MLKLFLSKNYFLNIESYNLVFYKDGILNIEIIFQSDEDFNSLKNDIGLFFSNDAVIVDEKNVEILNMQNYKLSFIRRDLNFPNTFHLFCVKANYNFKEDFYENINK